ncbi:MAG: thioredoxin domain-containing protein [Anaerolineales bacterium]|nr:thioredoxin domain-containing protein [Anaerolineales bacterium]
MNIFTSKWKRAAVFILLIGTVTLTAIRSQVFTGPTGQNKPSTTILEKPTPSSPGSLRPDIAEQKEGNPNRLIDEQSPYLLQHAYDPVDWYPWGNEAFEKAQVENKPIFLSIGYSTCHWCHVMKEEVFNDPEVARMLNETFVNIIVDREERPDIDGLYSDISVSMNGTSGWPLNVMMTYDQKPFYITTYIPRESRFGRLGMLDLIPQLRTAWEEQQDDLLNIADQVAVKVNQISGTSRRGEFAPDEALFEKTYQEMEKQFDEQNGGFGNEPKFPVPHRLMFLLRYWHRSGNENALAMVESSLQAMHQGGIYDQLGYGFHRYTTDEAWQEPHFEKMLYDQALMAMVYTEAYQITGRPEYAQAAHEIFAYILRDMTAASGGFYSAEDADSEGKEGGFYLWTTAEIREILGEEDSGLFIAAYNLTETGNYPDPLTNQSAGDNALYLESPLSELAMEFHLTEEELTSRLDDARHQLFIARAARSQLHRDDKILTDWNGLMISAFAKAGQVYDDPDYTKAAQNAADIILQEMVEENEGLQHRYLAGESDLPANINDYAFFTWGLIDLYESTFEVRYLENALLLTDELLAHFWDDEEGAFYFTPTVGEELLARQKIIKDRDLPSGNSVAALNLLRLSRLTANPEYERKAYDIARSHAVKITGAPAEYSMLMSAIDFALGPSYEVVIAGEPTAADTQAMLAALRSGFNPNKVVLLRPAGDSPEILLYAEYAKYNTRHGEQATAYVCKNYHCELPTTDIELMLEFLNE